MNYSKISILISLLFLVASFFFGLSHIQAIEYGGLGIYPSLSEVKGSNPLTRSWFIYTLESGEVKEGSVDIRNSSPEPQEVSVYPVDAVTTTDGAFAPEPDDKKKVDVGAWITLAESELSLEPGETKTIDFIIQVPENAEVGDHMGAIIIQSKEPPEDVEGSGLRISTRVGARMYITIAGDIVKELEFPELTWKWIDENITFYLRFVNKGNVRIMPKGEIEITDIFGKVVDTIKIPEREVFPGNTIILPVEWKGVPGFGKFIAVASVTYDTDRALVQSVTIMIFPSQQILFGVGLGLGILIILLTIVRRKLRKQKAKR